MSHISRCKHGIGMAMCDECYPKTKLQQGWEKGYAEMDKKHKWHKEIIAWANGAEIEWSYYKENGKDVWIDCKDPIWNIHDDYQYRIKPQPKEPQYLYVYFTGLAEVSLSTLDNLNQYELLGKIKLEDE